MASAKGRLLDMFGRWALQEGRITAVEALGERFVHLTVQADPGARYSPGDKIQILLPDMAVRTFTPVGWDGGRTELLAFRHSAETPAGRWLAEVSAGDTLRFLGPQRSLTLPDGPATLIGDETALAVAAAYRRARPGQITPVFEIDPAVDAGPALRRMGLDDARVVPRGAKTSPELLAAVASGAPVGLAGGGPMVQRIRDELRAQGRGPFKLKTYWLPGRAGLD